MADSMDDFDPWRDTEAERGDERDDTFDDGSVSGPFGPMSEILGVPRQVPGYRSRPTSTTSIPSRMFALALAAVLVVLAGLSIVIWVL